jgi:hypothetical protein
MHAAAAIPTPVDVELLEFLGSLDSDDEGWQEFLEQRPVGAAGKTPAKVPSPPGAAESGQVPTK